MDAPDHSTVPTGAVRAPSWLTRWISALVAANRGDLAKVALVKAALFFLAIGFVWVLPNLDYQQYLNVPVRWPMNHPNWLTPFTTWDGAHYLYLSQRGYHAGEPSCAFYPLWPLLIRLAQPAALGSPALAGFVLANTFALLAFRSFYRLASALSDRETAGRALILLLAFPGSLFFHFIYAESLFLYLTLLFFSALFREDYKTAMIAGFFLPLSKATGLFAIPALALWLAARRKPPREWLAMLGPVYGLLAYFGVMYWFTGHPLEGFAAEARFPNHPSAANILNLPAFLRALADFGHLHGMLDSVVDRLLFLIFLAFLPAIWRLNRHLFFFALAAGLLPAICAWFFSYTRFVTVCFPLFIVAAKFFNDHRRTAFWHFTAWLGTIQFWFLLRHLNFLWAG